MKERFSECDFLVCNGNRVEQAVQVSYDITSDKIRNREIKGLLTEASSTGCSDLLLLTDHVHEDVERDGHHIKIRPTCDWCVGID